MRFIRQGERWAWSLLTFAVTFGVFPLSVLAQSTPPASNNLIGTVPGLSDTARRMGVAIDIVCPALAQSRPSLNAQQTDLFDRCSEMKSTAGGLNTNSSPGGNTLGLGLNEFQSVLLGVTPDEAISQGTTGAGRSFSGAVGTRLAAVRAGATGVRISGIPLPGTALTLDKSASWSDLLGDASNGADALNKLGVFLNGHGSFGSRDDSTREPGFDFHDGGLTVGADYRFADEFVAGLAFTFIAGRADFNANLGDTDSRSYGLTAYATYSPGRFYLDGSFGFAWNTYDTSRNIFYSAGPGARGTACLGAGVNGVCTVPLVVDRTAKGDTDGRQFSFNIGMGYDFPIGALTITPTLRIETLYLEIDGYRESGAGGLDLEIKKQELLSVQSALGGRIAYAISTRFGVFVPQVMAEWRHEFEDDSRNIRARYLHDVTNTLFSVPTDEPDRDYFALGAGLSVLLGRGIGAFFNYETALGLNRITHHQFTGGFRMEF